MKVCKLAPFHQALVTYAGCVEVCFTDHAVKLWMIPLALCPTEWHAYMLPICDLPSHMGLDPITSRIATSGGDVFHKQ